MVRREALAELALFEVSDRIFTEGDVLGEEVVEVVADQRIVDTTRVSKSGKNN
jgi:hypothetical protein